MNADSTFILFLFRFFVPIPKQFLSNLSLCLAMDIVITNGMVYLIYERLPFVRGGALGNYSCFTFMLPIYACRKGEVLDLCAIYDQSKSKMSYYVNGKRRASINNLGMKPNASTVSDMSDASARALGLTSASTAWKECWVHDSGGDDPMDPVAVDSFGVSLGIFTLLDFLATPNLGDPSCSVLQSSAPPKGLANIQPGNLLPPVCGAFSSAAVQPPLTYNSETPVPDDVKTGQAVTLSAWTLEIGSWASSELPECSC